MSLGATYLATIQREPSLISYWRLNDIGNTQAHDSGNKNGLNGFFNGSPTRGPALIQSDSAAASYQFGTANVNISVSDISTLQLLGDLTLEAWVIPFTGNQSCTAFVGKLNATATIAAPYSFGTVSGCLTLRTGDGSGSTGPISLTPLAVGIPSHVVGTVFRSSLTIYVNGVSVGTGGGHARSDAGQSFYIGAGISPAVTSLWHGAISEVAVYNGALSATRVQRHFALGQQILSDSAHYLTLDPPVYS